MLRAPNEGEQRRSDLAELGIKSAVAGFGLSAGRGAYRSLTQNWLIIAIVCAVLLGAGYGIWNLVRGYPTSSSASFRLLIAIGLAAIGSCVSFGLVIMFGGNATAAVPLAVALQLASACVGAVIGLMQRPKRLLSFSIAEHNRRFLTVAGLVEVGGSENTLTDRRGNELVVEDWRRDRIVLRRTNGKGVAHITLDAAGRMLEYAPPA